MFAQTFAESFARISGYLALQLFEIAVLKCELSLSIQNYILTFDCLIIGNISKQIGEVEGE